MYRPPCEHCLREVCSNPTCGKIVRMHHNGTRLQCIRGRIAVEHFCGCFLDRSPKPLKSLPLRNNTDNSDRLRETWNAPNPCTSQTTKDTRSLVSMTRADHFARAPLPPIPSNDLPDIHRCRLILHILNCPIRNADQTPASSSEVRLDSLSPGPYGRIESPHEAQAILRCLESCVETSGEAESLNDVDRPWIKEALRVMSCANLSRMASEIQIHMSDHGVDDESGP